MSKRTVIIVVAVSIVAVILGIVAGVLLFSNKGQAKEKEIKTFPLTLNEMYCNIKDSKKIVKIQLTIESTSEKTIGKLGEKQFLIKDEVNKTIRNLTEEELQGKEGQINLQNTLLESFIELFDDHNITNIYFDEFIIQ